MSAPPPGGFPRLTASLSGEGGYATPDFDLGAVRRGVTLGGGGRAPAPYTHAPPPGGKAEVPIYQAAPPILSSHLVEAWMRIRADLQAEDPDRQLTGLVLIRKLLSSTGRTKHMQVFRAVLASECVGRFVFFLQEADTPTLQYEASWALTNICTDAQCVQAVVKHGALPIIVQLARNRHDNVASQALHAHRRGRLARRGRRLVHAHRQGVGAGGLGGPLGVAARRVLAPDHLPHSAAHRGRR